MLVRLQKFLADAGVASRRAGEKLIVEGRVDVNGETVTELGTKVDAARDRVTVDGRQVKAKKRMYLAVNKPPGYLCTRQDPLKRKTLGDLLPKEWTNLYSVGRLDLDSEGLIFVTNDGEFSLHVSHPRYGIRKKYLVTVEGKVEPPLLEQLQRGVEHEGEHLKADKARLLEARKSQSLVELELTEGKNREVRRMFEVLGRVVTRLRRTQIGPIKLGELPPGKWRTLTEPEIKSLLRKV